jgi:thioredoxin 1
MGTVEFTSDQQFENQVLGAGTPVLLDFTATWCQPCKAIAPLLEAMVPEYQGRLKIMKLDVDENPGTAMKYMVRSIPTLLLFKDGKVVDQRVGAVNRKALDEFVAKVVDGQAAKAV